MNVTAGPDLNIGEFTDVGAIVEEFASDSATVVVGTVIDEDLADELKVTVVATGLGDTGKLQVIAGADGAGGARAKRRASIISTGPRTSGTTRRSSRKTWRKICWWKIRTIWTSRRSASPGGLSCVRQAGLNAVRPASGVSAVAAAARKQNVTKL